MTDRKNFTPKTKRLVRERANGACEVYRIPEEMRRVRYPMLPETCQRDGADVDHVQPAWMGGEPTLENGAYLCKPCHAIKTVTDKKESAKAARRRGEKGQQKRRAEASSKMGGRHWQKHEGPSTLNSKSAFYVGRKMR